MPERIDIYWNWAVAVDLFVAGISAGAFIISALAYFIGEERYEKITRMGAYISPFPLLIGLGCLIYDLERPHLFWKLLLTVQINSIMSLGAWLLVLFSLISFLHFYLWLPERYDLVALLKSIPSRYDRIKLVAALKQSRFLEGLRHENLIRNRGLIAGIGIPVAIAVGIYTGVLLGVLSARPFWNNPMLPMLFLLSAVQTGAAGICFFGCFLKAPRGGHDEEFEANKFLISTIDFTMMIFSLIAVFLFVMGLYIAPRSSVAAASLIMGGEFTFLFWLVAVGVGILIPMVIEAYELTPHFLKRVPLREHNRYLSGAVAVFVLLGGLTLRYVVVYAGQMAHVIS